MLEDYLLKIVASDGVLHDNQKAEYLIADKGCDRQHIVDVATNKGFKVVIPPRKNANNPRNYDKDIYKTRHLSADFVLCEPSNKNGFVTTPTVRISASLAITSAAPAPVHPPIPAVIKTIFEPSTNFKISSACGKFLLKNQKI